jgi:hypothetical protein
MNLPLRFDICSGQFNVPGPDAQLLGCLSYLVINLPLRARSELIKKGAGGLRHWVQVLSSIVFGCSLFQATRANYMQIVKSVKGFEKFVS